MEWSVLSLLPDTLQSDIKDMGGRQGQGAADMGRCSEEWPEHRNELSRKYN
jgi:hypothetical protein